MEQALLYTLDEKKPNLLFFKMILDYYRYIQASDVAYLSIAVSNFLLSFKKKIQTWTFLTS